MSSRHSASWQLWVGAWLLGGMLVLTGSACSRKSAPTEPNPPASTPNNNAPVIMSLTVDPSQIAIGQSADVIADAGDVDGDALTYTWRAELGSIFGSGSRVVYSAAGCCAGNDNIHLTVADSRGATVSDMATIIVR